MKLLKRVGFVFGGCAVLTGAVLLTWHFTNKAADERIAAIRQEAEKEKAAILRGVEGQMGKERGKVDWWEYEEKVKELEAALAGERKKAVADLQELEAALAGERKKAVADLQKQIGEKDKQIAELHKGLTVIRETREKLATAPAAAPAIAKPPTPAPKPLTEDEIDKMLKEVREIRRGLSERAPLGTPVPDTGSGTVIRGGD